MKHYKNDVIYLKYENLKRQYDDLKELFKFVGIAFIIIFVINLLSCGMPTQKELDFNKIILRETGQEFNNYEEYLEYKNIQYEAEKNAVK